MQKIYRYRHRYRPIKKPNLSVIIGIGRYEKRVIGRPLLILSLKVAWLAVIVFVLMMSADFIWSQVIAHLYFGSRILKIFLGSNLGRILIRWLGVGWPWVNHGQGPTEQGRFGELVRRTFLIFKGNRSSDSIRGNRNFKRNPWNSVIYALFSVISQWNNYKILIYLQLKWI